MPNCKPEDVARFVGVLRNNGRMVTVEREAQPADEGMHGSGSLIEPGLCWVVIPLQPLWVASSAYMPFTTMERCIVPDAVLKPIEGDPLADESPREATLPAETAVA